jgi:hypothetical protein
VTVTSGLTYGTAVNLENQTVTLKFDLYQPTGDTVTSRAAIVWVHGPLPAPPRRHLRRRPDSHRDRGFASGSHHGAQRRRVDLGGPDRGGAGGRVAVRCAGDLRHHLGRCDAPVLDFHCTTDPLVSYSAAQSTVSAVQAQGIDAFLETWDETCHVP